MTLDRTHLRGIFPPFPTPTSPDGVVDEAKLRELVHFLLDAGVSGLVPIGGTGEYTALRPMERARVVAITIDEAKGRVPVIPGVLSPGLGEAVETGCEFRDLGASGLLFITPFYVTPSQDGIRSYFAQARSRIGLPLLLYDIPYRTHVVVQPSTIAGMAEDGSIIGMKACNPDLSHFNQTVVAAGDAIAVLSGEDTLFPAHVALGAVGGIIATASCLPAYWVAMATALSEGRLDEGIAMQRRLLPLLEAVFAEPNPGPLKTTMAKLGYDLGPVLAPLQPPRPETLARLDRALGDLRASGHIAARNGAKRAAA